MPITRLRCGRPPESLDALSADHLRCAATPIDPTTIAEQTIDALGEPLGLPPLAQCVTPDDRVAIAVGHGTPAAAPLVSGVVAALAAAGVSRNRMSVVAPTLRDADALSDGLEHEVAAGVTVEAHDPSVDDDLCFAGLARGDRPLMVNRTLFDADLLLPLSVEAIGATAGETAGGPYDGLFPDFFDQATIDRFRKVRTVNDADLGGDARRASRRAEADQAGWLLGAPLVIRTVAGPGGGVAAVVAGDPQQVASRAASENDRAWVAEAAEPSDVVLAIVSGGPDQQTWDAVGRALEAAERLTRSDGVIAVWSELDEPIGEDLARLADADDPDAIAAELSAHSGDSALAAWRIFNALQRGPVFFHSRLEPDAVENLGFAPVASAEEMLRMAGRFEDCLLLEEAQHVRFQNAMQRAE